MKTILIAIVLVIVAVLGWQWYESREGEAYDSSINTGAEDYDVNSSYTPLVSPNQTFGGTASGSIEIR